MEYPHPHSCCRLLQSLLGNHTAGRADLRGATGIHFKNPYTGAFSLVFEDYKKLAPTRVFNCTGKPIEAFYSDGAIAIYQFDGDLVMLIAAGTGNTGIKVPYPYALFFPGVAPLPLGLRLRCSTRSFHNTVLNG
jgi:hypothetical protein